MDQEEEKEGGARNTETMRIDSFRKKDKKPDTGRLG